MELTFENVPLESVYLMKSQIERFGASVLFESEGLHTKSYSGVLDSHSGKLLLVHDGISKFTVKMLEDKNHFPLQLLIGGIKQFIEEAVEDFTKGKDSYEKVCS